MLTFAVESGLHFLRMIESQALSKYRSVFITKLALQPPASSASVDGATSRYVQSMVGRAPDGRQLATLLRTSGPAQLVLDPVLNIALADRAKVQAAATNWLTWYDSMYSEPGDTDDAWNPPRLEYALSVGAPPCEDDALAPCARRFRLFPPATCHGRGPRSPRWRRIAS